MREKGEKVEGTLVKMFFFKLNNEKYKLRNVCRGDCGREKELEVQRK